MGQDRVPLTYNNDRAVKSVGQNQNLRKCTLILLYTFRKINSWQRMEGRWLNSLTKRQNFIDKSKLKALADDKLNVSQMMNCVVGGVENILRK